MTYTTKNFAENISHTTIAAMKIQAEYKALALTAATADYMTADEAEQLVTASQRARAASHLLTIMDGHRTDPESFFRLLDDALYFFVNERKHSAASTAVISHTKNLFAPIPGSTLVTI
jgi:hypothetical protein